jgi:hypothetical protein
VSRSQPVSGSRKIQAARYYLAHRDAGLTEAKVAELMGVPEREMRRAREILRDGVPEVIELVDTDQLLISVATRLVQLPAEEQRRIATTMPPAAIVTAVPADPRYRPETVERKPVGRGRIGPVYQMIHHIDQGSYRDVQAIAADWLAYSDVIKDVPQERLDWFLKELKKSRSATGRLIKLIEEMRKIEHDRQERDH